MNNLKKISAALGVVGLLAFFGPAHASTNLISNGTFTSNAAGWTLSGGCSTAQFISTGGNPNGNIRLDDCGYSSSDSTAAQTVIGLVVGATYTLTWDEKLINNSSGGGFGKSFGVFLGPDGGNALVTNEFLDAIWHTQTQTFVATNATQQITFAAELDTRTTGVTHVTDVSYMLDNVSLTQTVTSTVPEPGPIALLLIGMFGLAINKRRTM